MSHLSLFVTAPALPEPEIALLARHVAMNLVEGKELCAQLSITETELDRIKETPTFAARLRQEKARLLTLEGRRDLADWKQALTEHQYWDRLMGIALNDNSSAPAIIDGMKVVKRPAAREGGPGGGGGPAFVVNISIPNAEPIRVAATTVVEADSE